MFFELTKRWRMGMKEFEDKIQENKKGKKSVE